MSLYFRRRHVLKIQRALRVMLFGSVVLFVMGSCFILGADCGYAKSLSGYDREDAVAQHCIANM